MFVWAPVFQQPGLRPGLFLSIKLIGPRKFQKMIVSSPAKKKKQKFWSRFSVIFKFAILACQAIAFPLGFARNSQEQLQGQYKSEKTLCPGLGPWSAQGQISKSGVWRPWFPFGFAEDSLQSS